MSSKQSPGKVTLGMIKGKPITTSVPVIRYHASDNELEELYPSTDEDLPSPESDHASTKSSPSKRIPKTRLEDEAEGSLGRRSTSVDGSLCEGTPPSDPWKMLSDIRGKITKTFEEKLSEMKSERRKEKRRRSRENSSISDPEDLTDITPTEENISEKQGRESPSATVRRRGHFASFSNIKTGLKTKNSEEDSVESGVEAAELADEDLSLKEQNDEMLDGNEVTRDVEAPEGDSSDLPRLSIAKDSRQSSTDQSIQKDPLSQLMRMLAYRVVSLPLVLCCFYYMVPLPDYIVGLIAGVFTAVTVQSMITLVIQVLATPQEATVIARLSLPVLEIPAVEEHAVVERFEGWLNELPYKYDPDNYHVARTNPVFFRLEGDVLRVTETRTRIPKRAVWDEPKHKARFTRKRVYSLVDAEIELLPDGLIRRRRWSKKYPICIAFGREALIENTRLKGATEEEILQKIELDDDSGTIIEEEEETDEDSSQSKDTRDVFEDCNEETNEKSKIFVFARTDRQKEDWFRRLVTATNLANKRSSMSSTKDLLLPSTTASTSLSNDSKNTTIPVSGLDMPPEMSYNSYMARYTDTQAIPTSEPATSSEKNDVVWMNALLGRILFDLHKCPDTINLIQDRIQRKLSNIKLPYFMEGLLVSELVIGQGAPVIHKAALPTLDERGLWLDLDVSYEGCLTMTIETKLNLMKLKRAGSVPTNSTDSTVEDKSKLARSPMFDSDVEDSPETSTEDEDNVTLTASNVSRESTPSQSSGRKFLSIVDKLAANKYFQHATELPYVRRAMEGVSNTEIRLMVSVSSIEGCLVLNIPPPPSDRLWYGFKTVPKISLTAKPALGERAVNIVYVTNWIETKLLREFEKLVVLPNMDDLMISLCPNYPYVS